MLAPHTNTQNDPDGSLSDDKIHWLVKRAEGGLALSADVHTVLLGRAEILRCNFANLIQDDLDFAGEKRSVGRGQLREEGLLKMHRLRC